MAELITLEGKAQEKGKKVIGYKFPNNLDELKFPFKLLFHPNYKIGIKEKIQTDRSVTYKNVNMKPTDAIFVEKNGNELITKEGYVLSSFDKNRIVISPEKINSDKITNTPVSVTKAPTSTSTSTSNSTLEQDLNNSPLGKTARKIQIGFSVVGWGIFGLLAYKFWNKSTTWKVMLSVFGAYNLYSTYKVFSKPAIKVGDANIIEDGGNQVQITPTNNLTKSQKIDLIIKNQNIGEQMDADEVNSSKSFLNTLNDSDLNIWISLSKALKDDEIKKAGESGDTSKMYKIFQSKYGLKQNQVDEQMKKMSDFLTKAFESAGLKVTESKNNFSNFESDINLDLDI